MNLKLLVFFALLGAVASKAARKQRFLLQSDEPLENTTESPLKASTSANNNDDSDISESTNQSASQRPFRINSKRTRFPEERNATATDPNATVQNRKQLTSTPSKKQKEQQQRPQNQKGQQKPKKQQKQKRRKGNKNRQQNKRKPQGQRQQRKKQNRRKNNKTGKRKSTSVQQKPNRKSGVYKHNKSNRPKKVPTQG